MRPSATQPADQPSADSQAEFRQNRAANLIAVNLDTFWSIAILLLAFTPWDYYVDPAHWRLAFQMRLLGAAVVVATGLFQKLPGRAHWMPAMAKVRLITAIVIAALAAARLDRGYGFAVAGMVAIILTGPYTALDVRDLLATNVTALVALAAVMFAVKLDSFDMIGTVVFAALAMSVSQLLGRVLESSYRRAFELERDLHREARTDALTSLDNRRAMLERGPVELKRAVRAGAPVSLLLCDLDHFKAVNDRYGHDAGDEVLRAIAKSLRASLRETDLLCRWGGEEFLAVLVDADTDRAADAAERMRAGVEAAPLAIPEPATISIGVATARRVGDIASTWEALLKDADAQLYRAKSAGRNRVMAMSPTPMADTALGGV